MGQIAKYNKGHRIWIPKELAMTFQAPNDSATFHQNQFKTSNFLSNL